MILPCFGEGNRGRGDLSRNIFYKSTHYFYVILQEHSDISYKNIGRDSS